MSALIGDGEISTGRLRRRKCSYRTHGNTARAAIALEGMLPSTAVEGAHRTNLDALVALRADLVFDRTVGRHIGIDQNGCDQKPGTIGRIENAAVQAESAQSGYVCGGHMFEGGSEGNGIFLTQLKIECPYSLMKQPGCEFVADAVQLYINSGRPATI